MRTGYSASLLVLLLLAGALQARTYYVDDDLRTSRPNGTAEYPFNDIQQAIDHAIDGDTIIVAPGHYLSPDPWAYGEIDFGNKGIRLVSSAPTDFSVIGETVLCGVVIFQGEEGPDCLLQGFKIQNHTCGGILGNSTEATISHCIISGNGPCGATVVKDVQGPIANCLIVDNTTFHDCGVLPVVSGCPVIVNCTIANNISGIRLVTQHDMVDSRVSIRNCILYGNAGPQLIGPFSRPQPARFDHCLIQNWSDLHIGDTTQVQEGDPCFVQPGYWVGEPATDMRTNAGESIPLYPVGSTLVEGDYHLKSEGYRWSEQEIHGSHWYFDLESSLAIDAGDPMDSLGEELERAPQDPEGRWGVNHAIDLGVYGGTAQASLALNTGRPLGIGGVDLRDYWPFAMGSMWRSVDPHDGSSLLIQVTARLYSNGCEVYAVHEDSLSASRLTYWTFIDGMLYVTEDANARNLLPQISEKVLPRYPQYLTTGSTVETLFDPFELVAPAYRSAIVVRGTLAEVIDGTSYNLSDFISGDWHDVIAFRQKTADGTPGALITIFARGFGPLMLCGRPNTEPFPVKQR